MKTLQDIYLDWFNNFLTYQGFAEHYGLSVEEAKQLIDMCRKVHLHLIGE